MSEIPFDAPDDEPVRHAAASRVAGPTRPRGAHLLVATGPPQPLRRLPRALAGHPGLRVVPAEPVAATGRDVSAPGPLVVAPDTGRQDRPQLTAARAGAMSGKEPSDALRVVNALLTQLDRLKTRRNVLVLTTSNLPGAIDSAFVDRADVKFIIPLPPPRAVYTILRSCLLELIRVKLVQQAVRGMNWRAVDAHRLYRTGRSSATSRATSVCAFVNSLRAVMCVA